MPNRPMLARNVMVTRLVTLSPEMDVFEAIGTLLRHRISGAPVVDEDGRYLGVFGEECGIRVLVEAVCDGAPCSTIEGFMDRSAPTIDEGTDLCTIARTFLETHRRRLPVLRDGRVVGQISRRDVLRAAHDMLSIAPDREAGMVNLSEILEARVVEG
jgi:CBS domain-containing protein